MFFVYHGYCSSDNYDASEGPTYKITECENASAVVALKRDFDESVHDKCSNVIFRIFDGIERKIESIGMKYY